MDWRIETMGRLGLIDEEEAYGDNAVSYAASKHEIKEKVDLSRLKQAVLE